MHAKIWREKHRLSPIRRNRKHRLSPPIPPPRPPDVAYVKSAPIIKAGENKYVPEQISCYIVDCCPHCHVICGRKHRPRARRPGSNSCQHTHHVLFLSPTMHQEQMMVLICRPNCHKGIERPSCLRKAHRNTPWVQRGMISAAAPLVGRRRFDSSHGYG